MKIKIGFSVVLLVLLSAVVHAQTTPCDGTDPDVTCPIDSWVILLAAAASVFAAYTLFKRKKGADSSIVH